MKQDLLLSAKRHWLLQLMTNYQELYGVIARSLLNQQQNKCSKCGIEDDPIGYYTVTDSFLWIPFRKQNLCIRCLTNLLDE